MATGRRLEAFIRANWTGKRGISGFCDQVGVTREALYKWFRDETSPSLDHLTAMADALKVRRWEMVAAMDGDLDRQRELIALEVAAAVAPLRELLRDAGLLSGAQARAEVTRGAPQ